MTERYVLLGLARARSSWLSAVSRWADSAALPVEFVPCVSVEEVRARLGSGRPYSALLIDGAVPSLDRDTIGAVRRSGSVTLVVDDLPARRDWSALGAACVLAPNFTPDDLMGALRTSAPTVGRDAIAPTDGETSEPRPRGQLVAVIGSGGVGASVSAIALAQGLARGRLSRRRTQPEPHRDVLLADMCRRADQAMFHDTRVVVPGIQEVVEAHRSGVPALHDVRRQTFDVPRRGYRLMLGLRRSTHWVMLRATAFEAALDSLLASAQIVVADVDADLEGAADTGSMDVEDRHLLTRSILSRSDAVVLVGESSLKGLHALVRLADDVRRFGVAASRTMIALNRAPRSPKQRRSEAHALREILEAQSPGASRALIDVVHLPSRRLEADLRDGAPLSEPLPSTLAEPVARALGVLPARDVATSPDPIPIEPGSLAMFSDGKVP